MKNTLHTAAVITAMSVFVAPTFAGPEEEEHFDVWLQIVGDQLVTGAISEDEVPISPVNRVFGAELGEDPDFPFSGDEPGFQLENGTVEPGFAFDFALTTVLGAWNGDGLDDSAETITFAFGPQDVTSGPGPVEGFVWTADELGGFHDHFEITINGDGGDPAVGVYVIGMSIGTVDASLEETPPFYFVLNLGADEEEHDAAIEWVEANLVACIADLDGDGAVGASDLAAVLASWGRCDVCAADLDDDGMVGLSDLAALISAWGACP